MASRVMRVVVASTVQALLDEFNVRPSPETLSFNSLMGQLATKLTEEVAIVPALQQMSDKESANRIVNYVSDILQLYSLSDFVSLFRIQPSTSEVRLQRKYPKIQAGHVIMGIMPHNLSLYIPGRSSDLGDCSDLDGSSTDSED